MKPNENRSIRAYVMLRGSGGSLASGAPVSAENVQQFVADQPTRDKIRQELRQMGFVVRRVSAFSITVEAVPAQYESVFQAPLKAYSQDNSGQSAIAALDWEIPPTIPKELSDLVEAVVFPPPIQLLAHATE